MHPRDLAALITLAALWGGSYLFMRVASPEFGAIALIETRVAIAALVLLPFLLLRGGGADLVKHWRMLLVLGSINSAIPFCFIAFATLHLNAGLAGLLNASAPLFGAVIAALWLGERLDNSRRLGVVVGFAGVAVLAGDNLDLSFSASTLAVLAALLAAFLYGIAASYTRLYAAGVDNFTAVTGCMVAASLVLVPFAVMSWPEGSLSSRSWLAVTALGVACTGVAYLLYFRLITNIGPTGAISVTYLVPVFAVLWGVIFLDEVITTAMIVGSVVILSGTALATGLFRLPGFAGARVTAGPGESADGAGDR